MSFETLIYDTSDSVARVTLNRPEALNAFNEKMIRELHECWVGIDLDHARRLGDAGEQGVARFHEAPRQVVTDAARPLTTASPSVVNDLARRLAAALAIAEYRSVQSWPRRVNSRTVSPSRRTISR